MTARTMVADLHVVPQVGDEALVDLDLVERKSLQIGERGIADAEVIHGDAHAQRFQPAQNRDRAGKIVDQHAFGDFKLQTCGRQASLEQDRMNERGKVAVPELHRR
jgi:hypothetical protein